MKYIGFDGMGHQVRDCLHPRDLTALLIQQINCTSQLTCNERVINCSGGIRSARSLRQLTEWCDRRFEPHSIGTEPTDRKFDIPWLILDSTKAERIWNWKPETPTETILEEIAHHAEAHPDWLNLSAPY